MRLGLPCLLVVASTSAALAQSPGEYLGPRELAVGESLRGDARGGQSITLNPAGLALGSELVFEGSYGYRRDDSASVLTLSGCDSTTPVAGCLYYRYFTASPEVAGSKLSRRAHEGGTTLAKSFSSRLTVGVAAKYFDYESALSGEGDTSGFTFDAGVVVRLVNGVAVGVSGQKLLGEDSPQYPRSVGVGLVVRPLAALTLSFDSLWNLDTADGESTGRYGGGGEYFFGRADGQGGYALRGGAVHDASVDSTAVTAGVGLVAPKVGLDIAVRKDVSGGDGLLVLASLRAFGPRRIAGTDRYAY